MVGGRQALQSINGGGGRFVFVEWHGGDGEVTTAQRKDAQVVQVGGAVAGGGADGGAAPSCAARGRKERGKEKEERRKMKRRKRKRGEGKRERKEREASVRFATAVGHTHAAASGRSATVASGFGGKQRACKTRERERG